jgi:ferric-dicitrate binding protein FerR (iron transport regulator)
MKMPELIVLIGLLLSALPGSAHFSKSQADSHSSNVAGHITALLPVGHVQREEQTLVAAKDMPLHMGDLVKTDRGGRVRIALTDGSILNVSSDAELRILRHSPQHQQTTLELLYGRLLIDAMRISKKGARFEIRSPVAVAGVVGTRLGIRADPESSDVLCKEGTVRVRNRDSSVAGEVILQAGEFTRVERGKPPTPPAPASQERIQAGEDATAIPGSPQP